MKKTKNEKRRLQLNRKDVQREKRIAKYGTDSVGAVAVDFNKRFVAAFLAFVFALSCLVVGVNFASKADSDNFTMQTNTGDDLVLSKGIKNNGDGTYDLKLEAYATSSTVTTNLDEDVPLDIVMVLDQSGSMLEEDFNQYVEKQDSSYTIDQADGKYVLVDGKYRKLTYQTVYKEATVSTSTSDSPEYGGIKSSWTAQEAHDWVTSAKNNGVQNNGYLYFYNNGNYEIVYASQEYYRNLGNSVRIYGNFTKNTNKIGDTWNVLSYRETNGRIDNSGEPIYTYTTKANGEPFWHAIYSNHHGVFLQGYDVTLYYYTNLETGSSVSSSTYSSAVTNKTITLLGNGYQGYGWSWGGGDMTGNGAYYTYGDMYIPDTSSDYVKLYTSSQTLSWPLPGSSSVLDATPYSGSLYAKGYQLYYIDDNEDKQPIGDPVWYTSSGVAYNAETEEYGHLYEADVHTRVDALKTAASQFAKAVGDRAKAKGVDHRIAVVGFANNEIPSVSTARKNIVDVDNGASEFITTNSGIFVGGNFKSYLTPTLTGMTGISSNKYTNLTYFINNSGTYVPIRYRNSGWQKMALTSNSSDSGYSWSSSSASTYYYPAVTPLRSDDYQNALVDIRSDDNDNNNVNDNVETAISKLNGYGETYMSYGLAMAEGVFKNNSAANRKRIVVVFTDGQPGSGDTWDDAAANEALAASAKLKSEYDASVYTVGLYNSDPGATVDNFMHYLSSECYTSTTKVYADTSLSNTLSTADTYYFEDEYGRVHSANAYKSSSTSNNYYGYYYFTKETVGNRDIPVTQYSGGEHNQIYWQDSEGWLRGAYWNSDDDRSPNFYQFFKVNDSVADPSGNTYYYTASDVDSLNSIFSTISTAVQTPSTTTALGSDSVLKDVVSDSFILPENPGSKVTVETYEGASGTRTTSTSDDVTYSWDTDSKTLNVTGFDFSEKYIGGSSEERIVVTIHGLILKSGAKSSNYDENGFMKIPSNTSASGIYKSAEENTPYGTFPIPYALVDPYATYKNGMMLSKRIALNDQNTYDLTMTAFSTGKTSSEQIPTDYVLVVDQSGSMSTKDVPTGYNATGTTKNWTVADGANTYYYKVTDDNGDHYYRVYRKRGYMFQYHAQDSIYSGSCVSNLSWFQSESDQSTGKASQYWYNPAQDTSGSRVGSSTDDRFYPVTVSAKGGVGYYGIRFRYTNVDGSSSYLTYPSQPYYKSPTGGKFGLSGARWGLLFSYDTCNAACKALTGYDTTQYTYGKFLGINTGMYVRQVLFTRHSNYSQLAYKDDDGVEHLLIDATYCNSSGTPVGGAVDANGVPTGGATSTATAYWNGTLYTASDTITRLEALKQSMTEFVETVAAQNADHKIAICGFSSIGGSTNYNNTELLTGTDLTVSNNNGIQYDNLTTSNYENALLTANRYATLDSNGKLTGGKLKEAIDALTANGGTEGERGLYMAKNILDNRSSTTYTTELGNTVNRLKIVVYFTDGVPGNYSDDNQYLYGNKVVSAAAQIKESPSLMDTEIYSIGTFGFADSQPLTYEKYSGQTSEEYTYDADYVETYTYGSSKSLLYRIWLRNTKGYGDTATDTVSDYMRTISSEFPSATKFVDASWYGTGTKSDSGVYTDMVDRVRGSGSGGRHYFLCTDLSSLSRTFKTVASTQASAGAEYDATTILRDTIDGTKFDYSNATVSARVRMVDVDGAEVSGTVTSSPVITEWDDTTGKYISDDGVIEVTGIPYTTVFAGAGHDGEQLVVTISGIKPLQTVTGDTVYSNTDNAGIYTASGTQVAPFAKPFITRHSYTLDVGSKNTDATFTVRTRVVTDNGDAVTGSDTALNKVVLTFPNGTTRQNYYSGVVTSNLGQQTFENMGNESPTFYYEGIPDGYKVETGVTATDTEYKYNLRYDSETEADARAMTAGTAVVNTDSLFSFDNHVMKINSEINSKTVIIKEAVSGGFGNPGDAFAPTVYLVPPAGKTVEDEILLGDYTWTKVTVNGEDRWTTTLYPIKADGNTSIRLLVPTGWKLYVLQDDDTTRKYTVESKKYTVGDSTTSETYPENGLTMEDSFADNITVTITNYRSVDVPTGILDNDHFLPIWVWIAIAACLAAAGGFFIYDKKKKKKV